MIEFREQPAPVEQFMALFETTGWNRQYQATLVEFATILANSWLVISAYDGERLIGTGRVVTDGALHAMIFDMIINPDYQGQGIGSVILKMLVKRCLEANLRDIQLFCARGKRLFYEKHNFVARPEDAPGMQYKRPS
jgi:GNAT superfamily N-acetyltransferase